MRAMRLIRAYTTPLGSTEESHHAGRPGGAISELKMPASALVRKKEAAAAGIDPQSLPEGELIAAMVENPILVERPIVVSGGKAALGRPPEAVLSVL